MIIYSLLNRNHTTKMEGEVHRKRNGDPCDYHCNKRPKSSNDEDSEERSLGSCSGTTSSYRCDSGFRETVIRSASGEDSTTTEQNASSKSQMRLSSRVKSLEQKVGWIGSELQLIRQMLEFITKVIPTGSLPQFPGMIKGKNNFKRGLENNGSKSSDSSDSQDMSYKSYKCPRRFPSKTGSLPSTLTKQTFNPENFVENISLQQELPVKSQEKDQNYRPDQDCSSKTARDKSRIEQNIFGNSPIVFSTLAPSAHKVADIESILPKHVSAIDIIHLWEFGTTHILPIKLWSKEQLANGGERLSIWQQIIMLFKEECDGNLRTFVCKYSASNGDIMSVPEIIARSQLGSKSSSNSVSADYLRAKEMTCAKPANEQRQKENSTFNTLKDEKEFEEFQSFILPRKINGLKVSAKDVIRIWESGHGCIPPVKSWTPNQKLRQQSKISRWKKIVDIFKTECESDTNTFERRYSNECGMLMPIAAIISKYEQNQASEDPMLKPTMSGINNFCPVSQHTTSLAKAETFRRSTWEMLDTETERSSLPTKNGSTNSFNLNSQQSDLISKGYMWKEKMHSYSKEEFCREYINRCDQVDKDDNSKEANNDEFEDDPQSYSEKSSQEKSELQISQKKNEAVLQDETAQNSTKEEQILNTPFQERYPKSTQVSVSDTPSTSVIATHYKSEVSVTKPLLKMQTSFEKSIPIEKKAMLTRDLSPELQSSIGAFEVISLWENGSNKCPPIKLLSRDVVELSPKLSLWKQFMDIFHYTCNSDKGTLLRNFSNGQGHLLPVYEIVKKYFSAEERKNQSLLPNGSIDPFYNSGYKYLSPEKKLPPDTMYILPRKINGHKVSAKDVIHMWNHGFKEIPPVGSWLPQQKIRQQSKISRWKKIVEIFEIDCKGNMELFEQKYSSKTKELLPIAAIIASYELEKEAENATESKNIPHNAFSYSF